MTSDVRTTRNRRVISSLVSLAALAWTPVALADDAGPPRDNLWDGNWHWGIAFYGWLPGVSLDARYQLPSGAADTKTNNNIFSYLSGAFMMTASRSPSAGAPNSRDAQASPHPTIVLLLSDRSTGGRPVLRGIIRIEAASLVGLAPAGAPSL